MDYARLDKETARLLARHARNSSIYCSPGRVSNKPELCNLPGLQLQRPKLSLKFIKFCGLSSRQLFRFESYEQTFNMHTLTDLQQFDWMNKQNNNNKELGLLLRLVMRSGIYCCDAGGHQKAIACKFLISAHAPVQTVTVLNKPGIN